MAGRFGRGSVTKIPRSRSAPRQSWRPGTANSLIRDRRQATDPRAPPQAPPSIEPSPLCPRTQFDPRGQDGVQEGCNQFPGLLALLFPDIAASLSPSILTSIATEIHPPTHRYLEGYKPNLCHRSQPLHRCPSQPSIPLSRPRLQRPDGL